MKPLRRVMHVEDVPSIQVIARIALERVGGLEVLSCSSGQEALDKLDAFAPDLILLDAMLPEMDGVELLRLLAARIDLEQVPVVFLTGYMEPVRRETLLGLGAREVLVKPFDPMQLPAQLQEIWQRNPNQATAESR
ncbi:response regulator [Stutzerimonas tarimensis]|uniref:Response regulator n=1 Tax=Stutzerimonas tarimensis TaxID=1507735 RepID=A0ABV7T5P6_9GAMM